MEHRRVGGVVVAPVRLAGDDDVDRRLLDLHRPYLVGRRVGAQDDVVREVERVLHRPRRVVGRDVERGEVVVVELDLRALDDVEAHPDEDVLHLAAGLGDQVQVAGR
jgi:hypothetical protein